MAKLKGQCRNKIPYPSHKAAGRALWHIRQRDPDGKNMQPYQCGECAKWHLGHKPLNPVTRMITNQLRREAIAREKGSDEWDAEKALCRRTKGRK